MARRNAETSIVTTGKTKTRALLTEHEEQAGLIRWWGLFAFTKGLDERLLFAVPNGGRRTGAAANKLVTEGLRKGVADLFLAIPSGGANGLFIEMKRVKGGIVSDDQRKFGELVMAQGYGWVVCKGFEDARAVIREYLNG